MLPSSGYFQTINCPFYDSGLCDRPYCHYRHVKKDSGIHKEGASTISAINIDTGTTGYLGIGEDQSMLQQLVSEAVKKALQDPDLTSVKGDLVTCPSSPSTNQVSTKLVEKVIEGLKPLVAPTPTVVPSSYIPSYKPTPISELRKRHIPVPYTPKDTKTIIVKRQIPNEGGSHYKKAKTTNFKHREEYVPGIAGKSIDNEFVSYKPSASQNYGEVQYSPVESGCKSDVHYTPSDKSSLSFKPTDYVPSGLCEKSVVDAYKPTIRGESPIQEPEYQPDVGMGTAASVSYTPSKFKMEEESVLSDFKTVDSEDIKNHIKENLSETCASGMYTLHSSKPSEIKMKENVGEICENVENEIEEMMKECGLMNGGNNLEPKCNAESKEKVKASSAKHSNHHKEHRDKKSQKISKEIKAHRESKDRKDVKEHKKIKDQSENKQIKESVVAEVKAGKIKKELNDSKHLNHTSSKLIKYSKEKEQKSHRSSKSIKENRKERDSGDNATKSKHKHSISSEKKDKSQDYSNGNENKDKSDRSHKGHVKNVHERSNNNHKTVDLNSSLVSKVKCKSDVVHQSHGKKDREHSHSKKIENVSSSNSNINGKKNKSNESVDQSKNKHKPASLLEEVETLIKERLHERENVDSMTDSDTDEDVRTQECLKIFKSYKPEKTIPEGDKHKNKQKHKVECEDSTSGAVDPSKKRRIAHQGAYSIYRKTVAPKINLHSSQVLMKRYQMISKEQAIQVTTMNDNQLAQIPKIQTKSAPSTGKVRIAHVPNVSKFLDAKKNLDNVMKNMPVEPTVSQTVQKGAQRVAHVPPVVVTRRPLIYPDDHSKIPINVRQKYCNLIFDELVKTMGETPECCIKSIKEEESCYERCTSRNVYVNLAILTIQRLRNMEVNDNSKEGMSGGSRQTVSHDNIIGGKAKAKGLWSIMPPKKVPTSVDEALAYKLLMQKYVLTEEELTVNGYPRPHPTEKGRAVILETIYKSRTKSKNYYERICDRCGKEYLVNEKGFSRNEEQCIYHWGRAFKTRGIGGLETRYSCCQGEARSEGCTVWNCHISDMFDPDNQKGFVQVIDKADSVSEQIFSLDCEMCFTTEGMDLLRVTVINYEGETVFDTLVKPEKTVLDYSTRFSGITEEDMEGVTINLLDVQATLLTMFNKKTILIGHSLDSDLKALKLIHDTVVDTSLVFPHRRGPPFKRALKTLMAEYLQKIIQNGEEGHDSAEDALACIELMKWKLKEDLKVK